jgi:hypothetical protein
VPRIVVTLAVASEHGSRISPAVATTCTSPVVVLEPGQSIDLPPEIREPMLPKWRGPLRRRQLEAARRSSSRSRP